MRVPNFYPPNTMILAMGTPVKGTLIHGNPPMSPLWLNFGLYAQLSWFFVDPVRNFEWRIPFIGHFSTFDLKIQNAYSVRATDAGISRAHFIP